VERETQVIYKINRKRAWFRVGIKKAKTERERDRRPQIKVEIDIIGQKHQR
jgi:hypothetical protein